MMNNFNTNPMTTVCGVYFEDHTYSGRLLEISNFTNINFGSVRSTVINGKPYFCANDICRCLDIDTKNVNRILDYAVNDISTYITKCEPYNTNALYELYYYADVEIEHLGNKNNLIKQMVKMLFVSEHVMYSFVLKSRKPEAAEFRGWLLYNVIPKLVTIGKDNSDHVISQVVSVFEDIKNNIEVIKSNLKDGNEKIDADKMTGELVKSNIDYMANQIHMIYPMIADLMYGVNNILARQDTINNNVLYGNNINREANSRLDGVIKGLVALLDPEY